MEKERFNEIIDVIIRDIKISYTTGICSILSKLRNTNEILIEEYYEVKNMINPIFNKMQENGPNYDIEGNISENFTYLFPNNEKRIEFLKELKRKL